MVPAGLLLVGSASRTRMEGGSALPHPKKSLPGDPLQAAWSRSAAASAHPLPPLGRMELWSLVPLACLALSQAAPPPSGCPVARVAQVSTDFGVRVFREVTKASKDQNLAFSPFGVASVVAMLQVASGGNTRGQIKDALAYSLKGEELRSEGASPSLLWWAAALLSSGEEGGKRSLPASAWTGGPSVVPNPNSWHVLQ